MVIREIASGSAEHPLRRGRRGAAGEPAGQRLLLTVEEAADCLGIGRTSMFDLIMSGVVPSVRIGKLRRVRPQELETYIASLSRVPGDADQRVGQRPVDTE